MAVVCSSVFASPWVWVEEALDSRTRPWLSVPPSFRAADRTVPSSVAQQEPEAWSGWEDGSVAARGRGSWHLCGHLPVPVALRGTCMGRGGTSWVELPSPVSRALVRQREGQAAGQ